MAAAPETSFYIQSLNKRIFIAFDEKEVWKNKRISQLNAF